MIIEIRSDFAYAGVSVRIDVGKLLIFLRLTVYYRKDLS